MSNVDPEIREKRHEKCLKLVKGYTQSDPYLKRVIQALKDKGCPIQEDFYKCVPFNEEGPPASGYFDGNGVSVCEDIAVKAVIRNTLVHESIHAYDACRAHLNWDNCNHLACTEIRAANLSGDCKFSREIRRQNFNIPNQHMNCVKRRAELAVRAHPKCKDNAMQHIEQVWETCSRDYDPFDAIP